jgi:Protein of unknown function (DUF3102)
MKKGPLEMTPDIALSNSLTDLRERLKTEHAAAAAALTNSLNHAMAAGDILIEAKLQLRHGQWLPWLENCGIAERTAQRYIRLARNRAAIESKSDNVSDLSVSSALSFLATPRVPKNEIADRLADLAGHSADTAFDWLGIEAPKNPECERLCEEQRDLKIETLKALTAICQVQHSPPEDLELRQFVDEGAVQITTAVEDWRTATASDAGLSRSLYDKVCAELHELENAGLDRDARHWEVANKFFHELTEDTFDSAEIPTASTAAIRKVRDIAVGVLYQINRNPTSSEPASADQG